MRTIGILLAATTLLSTYGCAAEPPSGGLGFSSSKVSKGASDDADDDSDTESADTTQHGTRPSATAASSEPSTSSCLRSQHVTSKTCADSAMTGEISVKTEHVCDGSNDGKGQDVVTETDHCTFACQEREWVDNLACGPKDVEERILRGMKHVCDGSNQGKGQDIVTYTDISDCQGHSPLVLDLDGDGLQVDGLATSRARFDLLNDGHPVHTAWVGPREAFLTLDRNGDGIVNDRSELFGDMRGARNGFEDLALLDDDANGVIDQRDAVFSSLRLWLDASSDGVSTPEELHGLRELGVQSIRLGATHLFGVYFSGQWASDVSTFTTTDGKTHQVYDLWFRAGR